MPTMFKMMPLLAVAFLALGSLSACNTIKGAGADIEAAGNSIERSAERTKNY